MLGFGRYVHKVLHFHWVWMTGGDIGFAVIGLDILRRFLDGGHSEAAKVCSTCVVFVLKWVVCWTILSCKLGIECVLFFLSYSITLVVILITKKGTRGFFCFLIYCQHQGLLMKIISVKNSVFSSEVESLVDLEMTLCDGF